MSAALLEKTLHDQAWDALGQVQDPELDEPITDLGFVRSLVVTEGGQDASKGATVGVHLRLPTSFCSPTFTYLMASDPKDALRTVAGIGPVELDDHHVDRR